MTMSGSNDKITNAFICGVGGQGILLSSKILSNLALSEGYDVKKSEVHGMAQRGGSVVSHVRFGKKVHSPLIEEKTADFLLAFETMEGLRSLHYLKPGGTAVINTLRLLPSGLDTYPEGLEEQIKERADRVVFVEADRLAVEAGSGRAVNIVLLGVLSQFTEFPVEKWHEMIRASVKPKTLDVNLKAFELGRETGI
jgi:indolepyruvate ferredoxin oxidoreductase beta subunit